MFPPAATASAPASRKAFLDAGALAVAAGGNIPHDHLDHQDGDLLDLDIGLITLADEVRRHARVFEKSVDQGADRIVQAAA